MHSPVNMPIFVKNVTTDIHDQNAHLETEQGLLNPAPLEKSEYLVKGFSFSFRLGCVGSPISPSPKNHKSTQDHPEIIEEHIRKGIQSQRIARPFDSPPFPYFISSPLGIVPKSDPGKFRIIHDISFPDGNSVNLFIPSENSKVQYDTIDRIVHCFGKGALMAKSDITLPALSP